MTKLPFVQILFSGQAGVVMFFVLSGYVLSRPYVLPAAPGGKERAMFIPGFYARRIARIWLPWFAAFLLSMVARKYFFHLPRTSPAAGETISRCWQSAMTAGDFFKQCVFALHDGGRQLLNQDWSLGVELKASLLMPLFIFFSSRRFFPLLLALGIAHFLLAFTGMYYLTFILGVWLARYGDGFVPAMARQRGIVSLLILLAGLFLYQAVSSMARMTVLNSQPLSDQCGWVISSVGCVLLLLFVKSSPLAQAFLHLKPLVWLGRISYSVYLLQFIIILCVLPPFMQWVNHSPLENWLSEAALYLLTIAVAVVGTLGLAALSYYFVEIQSVSLGYKMSNGMEGWFKPAKQPAVTTALP